ncbi:MAG: ComF family protein [Phycisphaerae bacterium]|nr:ComF family protein [Phycisphaerae bacterium]
MSTAGLRQNLGDLTDLFLPPTEWIGQRAVEQADWAPDPPGSYCPRCGATCGPAAITLSGCAFCRDRHVPWHGVWRLGAYREPLAGWVRQFKFSRSWAWGEWFGRALAERAPDTRPAVVVPVPLHWRRRLWRGYDQAMLMARSFAAAQDLRVARVIYRQRPTRHQTRLASRAARRANIRRAFAARPVDLSGWTVWLMDDVTTSGTTAAACTRLLKGLGAERVNLAVAAVADPPGRGPRGH